MVFASRNGRTVKSVSSFRQFLRNRGRRGRGRQRLEIRQRDSGGTHPVGRIAAQTDHVPPRPFGYRQPAAGSPGADVAQPGHDMILETAHRREKLLRAIQYNRDGLAAPGKGRPVDGNQHIHLAAERLSAAPKISFPPELQAIGPVAANPPIQAVKHRMIGQPAKSGVGKADVRMPGGVSRHAFQPAGKQFERAVFVRRQIGQIPADSHDYNLCWISKQAPSNSNDFHLFTYHVCSVFIGREVENPRI